jgi:hypothetical protein
MFNNGADTYTATGISLAPGWTGDYQDGADLALIHLETIASLTGYDILRDQTYSGAIEMLGYGYGGTGAGYTAPSFGTLRSAENSYEGGDAFWVFDSGNPDAYAFDFDNGTAARDALCVVLYGPGTPYSAAHPECNTGLGSGREGMFGPGDSGGPSFARIDDRLLIVGVHSFNATFFASGGDVDNLLNGTFGELGGDTRVGAYAEWITSVPEPASIWLFASAAFVLAAILRRKNYGLASQPASTSVRGSRPRSS